uniref:(S)-N-methylcoclaurine 3'-hydroxylase isozyme 2 n=1 Tax=Anthurium amnicola TaxID=1678845 RepID=A0A1D1XSD8_9ARAE
MALLVTVVFFLPLLFLLVALLRGPWKHPSHLPPGPRPWPMVGNLVHLFILQRQLRRPPHAVLAAVAQTHGPLVHLRLGARTLVVASSPSAASAVLRVSDRELSGRYVPATFRIPFYSDRSLAWAAQCDGRWKWLRALCKGEIFSTRSLEALAAAREGKAREMVEFLRGRLGEEVRVGELAFQTVFNMLGNMLFSRDVLAAGTEMEEMKGVMSRGLELGMTPNVEDLYPGVFGGLDLQGLRREARKHVEKLYGVWDGVIGERRKEMEGGERREAKEDFLKLLVESGCDDLQLKALFLVSPTTTCP